MAFDWMKTLKTGFLAWLIVGIVSWILGFAGFKVGLDDVISGITANPLMVIIGAIIAVFVTGIAYGYAEKEI